MIDSCMLWVTNHQTLTPSLGVFVWNLQCYGFGTVAEDDFLLPTIERLIMFDPNHDEAP